MPEKLKIDVALETRDAEREAARTRAELGAIEAAVGRLDARTKDFRRTLEGGTSQASALGRQLREALSRLDQQTLAALRGNVSAAFEAVRGGAEAMARSAGEAERLGRANVQLGLDYGAAARGAGGVLDELQLLNATQALTGRGIQLNQTQLAAFSRTAQDYARSTGREFNSVAEQLAEVVAKGGEESARFGSTLGALAAPTNTAADRLDALTQSTQGTVPAARTSAEAYRDLTQAVTDAERSFSEGFAEGIAELNRVHGETTSARDAMRELKDDVYAVGATAAHVFGTLADTLRLVATEISGTVRGMGDAFDTLTQMRQHPLQAGELLRGFGRRSDAREAASEAAFRRLWADLGGGPDRTTLDVGGGPGGGAGGPPRRFAADNETGGGSSGATDADMQQWLRDHPRAANTNAAPSNSLLTVGSAELNALFDRELQRTESRRAEELGRLGAEALQTAFVEQIRGATGVSRDAAAAAAAPPAGEIDRRNAQLMRRQPGGTLGDRLDAQNAAREQRALDDRLDAMRTFTERWEDLHHRQASAAQAAAEGGTQAFQLFGKALSDHVNLVIDGRETVAQGAAMMLADTLGMIGKEAIVKGAMETAEGLAMLAGIYTAPLAPGHFAAAAAYFGVGALATAGGYALANAAGPPSAAGGSPSGAAAGPPSAPVGALAAANDNGRSGPTEITINLGGGMVLGTPRELGEALARAINDPLAGVQINSSRVQRAA